MLKRIALFGFIGSVLISGVVQLTWAAEPPSALRRTPIVVAVEKASPAVVNISTEQIVRAERQFQSADPFFDQFFRDFLDPFPRRQYKQSSLGSGVIFDARGYVLTNYHVILKASKVTITLADNREFEAEIVGSDPKSDLAVLKVTVQDALPVATLGHSDDLMIGEPVIAIGNPFGLSHTITTGVLSALNRTIRVDEEQVYHGFMQTDAPINPGNSGGPLVNIEGAVIGINTAIYGNAQGIGFAIPIDKVKRIVDDLIAYGDVRTAWLGLVVQDITPELAKYFDYDATGGVLIAQILKDTTAAQVDVQQGDILVALNGLPVQNQAGYEALIEEYTAGDAFELTLLRKGQTVQTTIPAEEFSVTQAVNLVYQDFGMFVAAITPQAVQEYELATEQGVVVAKIRKNSPAAQVGIEPGDVIRQISAMPVADLNAFRQAVRQVGAQAGVAFLIQRGARGYYITLERQ